MEERICWKIEKGGFRSEGSRAPRFREEEGVGIGSSKADFAGYEGMRSAKG